MSGPDLSEAEISAVVDVLRSGRLSLGPKVDEFERALADRTGARHAVGVSGGTAAVHLSLVAVGVSDGDYVVTSPFSFVATAHAVRRPLRISPGRFSRCRAPQPDLPGSALLERHARVGRRAGVYGPPQVEAWPASASLVLRPAARNQNIERIR